MGEHPGSSAHLGPKDPKVALVILYLRHRGFRLLGTYGVKLR